jgi:hypothetical protein
MINGKKFLGLVAAVLMLAGQAFAQKIDPNTADPNNIGPPPGALLDLAPGAIG